MELLIIESTKEILQESQNILWKKNKKYYRDVLDFLNLLFEDDSKNITNIKFKKITLNENIFNMYNEINKVYMLNKPYFDSDNFDLNEISISPDIKNIFINIAFVFANNLLDKLNYKLVKKFDKNNNKIKFILQQS